MTDRKASGKTLKIEPLELNRETVQDLTDSEADAAQGGKPKKPKKTNSVGPCGPGCRSAICQTTPQNCPLLTKMGHCDPAPR